jgi:hypothetical protein
MPGTAPSPPVWTKRTHCISAELLDPLDKERRNLWTSEHCAVLLGWQVQTDWRTGEVFLFIQRMPIYQQGVIYRHTAMMQSSSRSPRPHIGASMITSLYVVITGTHESCRGNSMYMHMCDNVICHLTTAVPGFWTATLSIGHWHIY